jgi:sugar-specific transcriptional regulator TrmB
MNINPLVENKLRSFLKDALDNGKAVREDELLDTYDGPRIHESELRAVIKQLVQEGAIETIREKTKPIRYRLVGPISLMDHEDRFIIVVSRPQLHDISLEEIQERNNQINTVDCFRAIIQSSLSTLRICSPFMEFARDDSAFPDLEGKIYDAFLRGVKIKVLSREITKKRSREALRLKQLAEQAGRPENIQIVDYYFERDQKIFSSTHAKLLIADTTVAYVGSGELRRNSLIVNFEVGCQIMGPSVYGLCEIFDSMFNQGRLWN